MRRMTRTSKPRLWGRLGVVAAGTFAVSGFLAVGVPPTSATSTVVDLGTIGGSSSWANATDGHFAVGAGTVPGDGEYPPIHAAYSDLTANTPSMLDLGTLGGSNSDLYSVSGGWATGYSDLAGDQNQHAVVVNLNSRRPALIDVGTLGGSSSQGKDVRGGWAVGYAATSSGYSNGFAVNLSAKRLVMIDLPPQVGYTDSFAASVDGTWVVGSEGSATGSQQGVAWNLAGATANTPPTPVALPPLTASGDSSSSAIAVSNGWAVGSSSVDFTNHAVAWNLSDPTTAVQLPGLLGSGSDVARAVSWPWVVGQSAFQPAAWNLDASPIAAVSLGTGGQGVAQAVSNGWAVADGFTGPAFAVDLALDPTVSYPLSYLAGGSYNDAESVAGGWVVGQATQDAAAWPLSASVSNAADAAVSIIGPPAAHNGKSYTATVTVRNNGPNAATGVTVNIGTITNGTSLIVTSPINNATVSPGTTASETVTVTASSTNGKTLTIPVSVASTTPDTNPANNNATLTSSIKG